MIEQSAVSSKGGQHWRGGIFWNIRNLLEAELLHAMLPLQTKRAEWEYGHPRHTTHSVGSISRSGRSCRIGIQCRVESKVGGEVVVTTCRMLLELRRRETLIAPAMLVARRSPHGGEDIRRFGGDIGVGVGGVGAHRQLSISYRRQGIMNYGYTQIPHIIHTSSDTHGWGEDI